MNIDSMDFSEAALKQNVVKNKFDLTFLKEMFFQSKIEPCLIKITSDQVCSQLHI